MFESLFGPMFDIDGNGVVDDMEMGFGFMMMDEFEKEQAKRNNEYGFDSDDFDY